LETDQRAGVLLVGAPDFCCRLEGCIHDEDRLISQTSGRLRDIGDIDLVLGSDLSRGQSGDHGKEKKADTTHVDRLLC
jgi:hypothetical protein